MKITTAMPSTPPVAARGWTISKRIVLGLSGLIAIVSYRYLFGSGLVPPTVLANRHYDGWILVHATNSATALLIGSLQFNARLRHSRPRLHRFIGVTYVTACLGGGLSSLPLAIGTSAGPFASAGFIALGLAWMTSTAIAVKRILAGRIASHGQWMTRSFALTLAALTLRIYLFASGLLRINYFVAYPMIAWACWLPNVLAAEWHLRYRRRQNGAVDANRPRWKH